MKVTVITRKIYGLDIPHSFKVGVPVLEGGQDVKAINFYETGCDKGNVFRGPCFVVQYEGTGYRNIIPATEVIDIAAETKTEVSKVMMPATEME